MSGVNIPFFISHFTELCSCNPRLIFMIIYNRKVPSVLWYDRKRKQITKLKFLVKYTGKCVCHLHWHLCNIMAYIFKKIQQEYNFCSKFGLEEKCVSTTQLRWILCHLLSLASSWQRGGGGQVGSCPPPMIFFFFLLVSPAVGHGHDSTCTPLQKKIF